MGAVKAERGPGEAYWCDETKRIESAHTKGCKRHLR
jgi:hypothetical protein